MTVSTAYEPHSHLIPSTKDPLEAAAARRRNKSSIKRNATIGRKTSRIRLTIRIVSFLLTAAAVVALAQAVSVYYRTLNASTANNAYNMNVRVWPRHMLMKPTLLLLGAAGTATFLSGLLCLASFVAKVRHITTVGNLTTTLVSTICIALWLAVIAYYRSVDIDAKSKYDMLTFTCLHQKNKKIFSITGNMHSLCLQMRYSWWTCVVAVGLELLALATVIWGWVAMRKKEKYVKIVEGGKVGGH